MNFKNTIQKRLVLYIVYILLGIALAASGIAEQSFSCCFALGCGFIGAGGAMAVKYALMLKNPDAIKQREIAERDERNIAIAQYARSITFAAYIILSAAVSAVLYITENDFAANIVIYNLCAVCVIYRISYFAARKRF